MNSKPEAVQAVIGIVQRGEEFLVGWRQPGQIMAGKAEFPGGKVNEGESLENAVKREVFEETGIPVQLTGWSREIRHEYAHGLVHLTFFQCQPIGDPVPRYPFEWLPRRALLKLPFPGANEQILVEIMKWPPD